MAVARAIRTSFLAVEKKEGLGASVRRSIGTRLLRNLSPFILLDHFTIPSGAGFPEHPHRGQETITYMLQGAIDHEDFTGSSGSIEAGDLQFMTAGRGIMHAEMPRKNADGSSTIGLQLWVDLPSKLKKTEPRYRDLRASEIPNISVDNDKVHIKIISGQSHGVDSVVGLVYTPIWMLDIQIKPGGKLEQRLPQGWNAFAYTLSGTTTFGKAQSQRVIGEFHNVVFEKEGDIVSAKVLESAETGARFLLIAGSPLEQPIIQHGPFVLDSQDEVIQALMDFQNKENGFERGRGWTSKVARRHGM
ncbi:putative pirin-2 [Coleophoma cylindrospora]|uniref:Putative pirin-2 n=1 Tax=Coleophoma cylindrospora TaxID=1849047 RepID=A0A3D8Q990_9HELO|nr:putative pirin-2 [Coleophoma cylindrospora]